MLQVQHRKLQKLFNALSFLVWNDPCTLIHKEFNSKSWVAGCVVVTSLLYVLPLRMLTVAPASIMICRKVSHNLTCACGVRETPDSAPFSTLKIYSSLKDASAFADAEVVDSTWWTLWEFRLCCLAIHDRWFREPNVWRLKKSDILKQTALVCHNCYIFYHFFFFVFVLAGGSPTRMQICFITGITVLSGSGLVLYPRFGEWFHLRYWLIIWQSLCAPCDTRCLELGQLLLIIVLVVQWVSKELLL